MPTFIDMSVDLDHITMADVIQNDNWDFNTHNGLLGNILKLDSNYLGNIDPSSNNRWAWYPSPSSLKLFAPVYNKLNDNIPCNDSWTGWKNYGHSRLPLVLNILFG